MTASHFAPKRFRRVHRWRRSGPRPTLALPTPPQPWLWRQTPAYSPLRLRAIVGAVRQVYGERTDPLPGVRALLRQHYRADAVYLLASGTQALQLALRTAGRLTARPLAVALPAYGCFDIASAAVGAGADITLYDVDPETLAPDLDSFAAALADGARVAVVAPLYGLPVPWEELDRCARETGAVMVEDAAQGHGATSHGMPLGSLGRISTLSFGRGKGWTAGRGGALLFRGHDLPDPPRIRRSTETSAGVAVVVGGIAQSVLGRPRWYRLPAAIPFLHLGETRYQPPRTPRKMSAIAAAVLLRTYPAAAREARLRCGVAADWLARLPRCAPLVQPIVGAAGAGYLRLPVLLARGFAGFRDPDLALRLGLAPGYPTTLAGLEPVRARLFGSATHWPGAEELTRRLVTLPTHSRLTVRDRDALLDALCDYRR